MNILIIPTNDWVRAPGHGHIDYIAEKLAERGHKVYAWYFDIYRSEQVKRMPKKVKLVKSRTLWLRDPALFFFVNAMLQGPAMLKTIRDLKIDVVINENIFSGLVAFLVSNSLVLRVFDFSDYFPESASIYYENASQITKIKKKMVEAVTLTITKLNIKTADVCLSVCRSLIDNVHRVDPKKFCYFLPNTADISKHTNLRNEQKEDENARQSGPIIAIMGVIDNWLDLITPLRALKILCSKFPDVKLVIIGPWRKKEFRSLIEDFIEREELTSHVLITGYVSDQLLAYHLKSASFCIMPFRTDNYSSIIRLPEKLFVYSAYGKPILSTPLPEVMSLRPEHVSFYHDVNELTKMASAILTERDLTLRLSSKALEFARKYDISVLAERLENILLENLPERQ